MSKSAFLKIGHGNKKARILYTHGKKRRRSHTLASKQEARQTVIKLHGGKKITISQASILLDEIRKSSLPEETPEKRRAPERSTAQHIERILVF